MSIDKSFLKNINVIYVEDEDEIRTLTAGVLSKFVNSVTEAVNGAEGLELFKKHNEDGSKLDTIDLIITDINMPKMNGLDMLEQISLIDSTVPSIVTTAHNDADFLKKAINQRVRGYVSKPLNIHSLIDTIVLAVEPKYLKDKLEKTNKHLKDEIKEKTMELRSILDAQDNMILVINEEKLSEVNKTLLNFFNLDTMESFQEKYGCISSTFIENDNYFYTKNYETWIDEIIKLEDIKRVVKIKNFNGDDVIFQVDIKSFINTTKHFVVSFTDITQLKQYTYELQYKANHDNLTKLYNRQKLNDELNKEVLRENRYKHGLSLLMFDIDDFKNVNDTYGHDIGDVVLIDIANILKDSTRSTDIACRWGGEEFMVLLPETNITDTINIAETIRKNVENYKFSNVELQITISIGAVEFIVDVDDKETFIKHADVAMYKAKNSGKNQVVVYEK